MCYIEGVRKKGTSNGRTTMKTITKITNERYGAGILIFDPTVILWAADKAADEIGVEAAKKELKKVNGMRHKHGKPDATFPYGHRMF
jgi:hypothetical protein